MHRWERTLDRVVYNSHLASRLGNNLLEGGGGGGASNHLVPGELDAARIYCQMLLRIPHVLLLLLAAGA